MWGGGENKKVRVHLYDNMTMIIVGTYFSKEREQSIVLYFPIYHSQKQTSIPINFLFTKNFSICKVNVAGEKGGWYSKKSSYRMNYPNMNFTK